DYLPKDEKRLVGRIQAYGERADFSSKTGLIQISGGHPSWRAGPREGRGDELIIDRTNQIFQANGHAWLKMPGQSLGSSGLLSRQEPSAKNPSSSTNNVVEVLCDSYELRTNLGVFRQDVRVNEHTGEELRGKMTCSLMTLTFAGSNELQTLCAETNVVIEQETNRFAGGRAVYTATNSVLQLTENPTWQAGPKSGKGDFLRLNAQANELFVWGNAFMRMPAEEFAGELVPDPPGQ